MEQDDPDGVQSPNFEFSREEFNHVSEQRPRGASPHLLSISNYHAHNPQMLKPSTTPKFHSKTNTDVNFPMQNAGLAMANEESDGCEEDSVDQSGELS